MAEYEIKVREALLSNLLGGGKEGLGELVESVLNQVLEAQAEEQLGAGRYERCEARRGYRNGYRTRQRYRRVGPLTLRVPQFRDGSFSTEIFQRYQRSEQALVLALRQRWWSTGFRPGRCRKSPKSCAGRRSRNRRFRGCARRWMPGYGRSTSAPLGVSRFC